MSKRKPTIPDLWSAYISQSSSISPETQTLVSALRTRIDQLELANALLRGKLKAAGVEIE